MNELHLFAGAGGGILGGMLLGHRPVCAVEIEPYCRRVLLQRQRDGILPWFPIWDDVRTFDGRPWQGIADVVCGGFPCQDISAAGKGAGIDGERSGLWREMARIIGEVRPRFVFVENSPMLVRRGLARVVGDLAALGYDSAWCVLGADDCGAPHKRKRLWILAHADSPREQQSEGIGCEIRDRSGDGGEALDDTMRFGRETRRKNHEKHDGDITGATGEDSREVAHTKGERWEKDGDGAEGLEAGKGNGEPTAGFYSSLPDADCAGRKEQRRPVTIAEEHAAAQCGGWWCAEPAVGRVAHGVAHRVDRIAALGNGQVPDVVLLAWSELMKIIQTKKSPSK